MSYRTSRSSRYGYKCPTELTEVLCRVIPGVNTPGTFCEYPTEHNLELFDLTAGVCFNFFDIIPGTWYKFCDNPPFFVFLRRTIVNGSKYC